MNSTVKTVLFWLLIVVSAFLLWEVVKGARDSQREKELTTTQFMSDLDQNTVHDFKVSGMEVRGKLRDGSAFHTTVPATYFTPEVLDGLTKKNVEADFHDINGGNWGWLIQVIPIVLIGAVWIFMLRQMQTGGNKALSFGKSRARLLSMQQKKVTFKDVAGVDEAKEELREIIEFLREAQKFQKLGGRIPKGVLLVGPPGTGKTLLARAVAGEANVPFFSISGSDFVEMFVGVGASRVRDLFEQGKKNAPCIIFIDEIDAVGRHRGAGLGGGHDEREQTLNQLLVEMDGFESNEGVILMAATNRPDVLDPALLRPGRFDRRVVVSRPDVRGREEILRVHTRKIPLAEDVDLSVLGPRDAGILRRRPGQHGQRSGAGCGAAESQGGSAVRLRAGQRQSPDGRGAQVAAAHRRRKEEHGLSRGWARAGGGEDAEFRSAAQGHDHSARHGAGRDHAAADRRPAQLYKNYLETEIAILMGGRIAEEMFLNVMSTGAGNDIERATDMARKMVCEWGMSDLGPLTFGKKEEQIFLGREIAQHRDYSEDTAIKIDQEVRKLVNKGYSTARQILSDNRDTLERIARALIEREVLDANEIKLLVEGKELPPVQPPPSSKPDDGVQHVIKPELQPGRAKGGERPATA